MKVVHFTDFFFPAIGGVPTSIMNLSSGLAKKGHSITIVAPRWPSKLPDYRPSNSEIKIIRLPSLPSLVTSEFRVTLPVLFSLYRRMKEINPDVIHLHSPSLVGWYGLLMAKLLKKPLIISFHGYFMEPDLLVEIKLEKFSFISKILWKYYIFFLSQCNTVISPSQFSKKDLEDHGCKVPIVWVPNSINESIILKETAEKVAALKEKYKLKKNVVLVVSRLNKVKNLDLLLYSMQKVITKVSDTSLCFIGDGGYKAELIALTKKLGLEDSVVFCGEVQQKELLTKGYFQMADVLASSSATEILPLSIMESMYFGLPQVGVSPKGVGEMIKDVGLTSGAKDSETFATNLIAVLTDEKMKQNLSEKTTQRYTQNYKWSNTVEKYEKILDTLVHKI